MEDKILCPNTHCDSYGQYGRCKNDYWRFCNDLRNQLGMQPINQGVLDFVRARELLDKGKPQEHDLTLDVLTQNRALDGGDELVKMTLDDFTGVEDMGR